MSERSDDPDERELEGFLQAVGAPPAPPPRPEYRSELRASFVGGAPAATGAAANGGASLRGRDARTAGVMIEDLLGDQAPPPRARAAFRDEMRARFVRGDVRERPAPAARPAPRTARGPALRLVVGGLAAAAALWLVARVLLPNDPAWRGFRATGEGPVVVDGRELVPRDLAEVGAAFAGARVLESRARRVELIHEDALVLALLPGTELETLADGTGGELRFALRRGEVYLKTHSGYSGPAVVIETTDMDMRMVGTVVGVLKADELSCICVARGSVAVTARAADTPRMCQGDLRHVVLASGEERFGTLAEKSESAHVRDLLAFADESF